MTEFSYATLRRGDGLWARVGSKGRQYAIVHGWTRSGNCRVLKWSHRGQKWTGPTRLYEHEALYPAASAAVDGAVLRPYGPIPPKRWARGRSYDRNPIGPR